MSVNHVETTAYQARRELLWNLVIRNLKIRYKNSSLGFFWTLLNPVLLILIYYFFIRLMRFKMNLPELLTGVIPWHFFTMTLTDSIDSISGNSSLITKVRFPRIILPLSAATANLINYSLSLLVLIVFLPMLGCPLSLRLVWLIPLVVLTYLFTLGVSLLITTSNVYFKDTSHLLSVGLMVWFFLTPIIYPLTQIPERFIDIAFTNPMTVIVMLYRFVVMGNEYHFNIWNGTGVYVILFSFILGLSLFIKFEPYFADEL